MRLGIVGGNGWIGGAIARAVVDAGIVAAADLTLSCRRDPPEWLPEAHWTRDNQALADRSEVIFVAVRPQDWPAVRLAAGGRLVVSVMAGPTLAAIAAATGTERVVRALPNAAATVGRSYTPWIASPAVAAGDRAIVRRILGGFGTEDEVGSEGDTRLPDRALGHGTCVPGAARGGDDARRGRARPAAGGGAAGGRRAAGRNRPPVRDGARRTRPRPSRPSSSTAASPPPPSRRCGRRASTRPSRPDSRPRWRNRGRSGRRARA